MLPTSKHLEAFKRASSSNPEAFKLIGDCLIVELIADEELKTKSGIILASVSNKTQVGTLASDKPTFVRVLMVGEGYYSEENGIMKDVPLDVKPGDIALVGAHAIKRFSVFGNIVSSGESTLGLVSEGAIQMRFNGEDGFNQFFDALNSGLESNG